MIDTPKIPRRPFVAAVLSLLCTGLGHVYCGRIARGVTLFLVSLVFVPLFLAAGLLAPSTGLLAVMTISLFWAILVYLFAVYDSIHITRRLREGAPLTRWNRPSVYAIAIILGFTAPLGGMALVRAVAFRAYDCPSRSMVPAVEPGDRILVNRLAFRLRGPRRGEIVVFRNPEAPSQHYIKRVVGLPGDRVEGPKGKISVPRHSYWVLGDARANSRDSRHFGFVPEENMVGSAQYIVLPPCRFGRLPPSRGW